MQKIFLFVLLSIAGMAGYAQEPARTAPVALTCVETTIGGCFPFGPVKACTPMIYHINVCCQMLLGATIPACVSTSWATVNPDYRMHGEAPPETTATTLEAVVLRYAAAEGIKASEISTFTITDCAPFQGADGKWYVIAPNTYKIDKTEAGWRLTGLNFIAHEKQ